MRGQALCKEHGIGPPGAESKMVILHPCTCSPETTSRYSVHPPVGTGGEVLVRH